MQFTEIKRKSNNSIKKLCNIHVLENQAANKHPVHVFAYRDHKRPVLAMHGTVPLNKLVLKMTDGMPTVTHGEMGSLHKLSEMGGWQK